MPKLNRLTLAAALVASATPALAQNVPTRTLSKPDAEFSEPFTQIAGVRELKDGRLIVIDPRDKTVQVVDMARGSATKLGREGSGPGEYGIPMRLMTLPGDTTAIGDMLNNRLLLINPNATVGGFVDLNVPPPPSSGREGRGEGGGQRMMMVGGNMPTMSDAKGRMYYQGPPFRMTDNGPQSADSVPLIRWDRGSGKRDTLAWLRVPQSTNQITSRGGRGNQQVSVRIGGGPPFNGADQMLVAPDGRVAIAHFDPYSIDFISASGQRTRGQPIRYDRQRISEGHKAEWREAQKSATGLQITNENGRRSANVVPGGATQDPEAWGGDYMPPFLQQALNFSNEGYLWVRRTGPAGQPPTFDVIDRAGNVVQRVVLPKRSRVVGFGNGAVYTVRLDEDDLQYLQKHKFTMPDRP
jgi:hypothetical protein